MDILRREIARIDIHIASSNHEGLWADLNQVSLKLLLWMARAVQDEVHVYETIWYRRCRE